MKLLQWLSGVLFPEKCVLCGRILQKDELDLCHHCRIDAPECPMTREKYSYIDSWTALWYYEDKVRHSLLKYKFYGRCNYAATYARLLGMKLLQQEQENIDVLTWIPVSEKRRRKRGFDQVELIARHLGENLGITPLPTLKKIRDNPPQSGITGHAERRANVLGVYIEQNRENFYGKRVLLLDDILTTGATAGECARVLLTAGAAEVHLAVVAVARKHKKGK